MSFKYAIVLTGGIATGKSTVAKFFLEDGFVLIDADKIAHEMLDLHQDKIVDLFGTNYVQDGTVDRKALGSLIFSNAKEKLRLEELLHPLIYKEIKKQADKQDKLEKPYLIDIPLFFESKRYLIKKSIVVYTPKEKQLERLMERDGSTQEEAQKRIDSQLDIEEKKQLGTYIVDNSQDLKHLQQEYVRVKKEILDSSKGQP
jgi:dephospho-CoA kinase